MFVFFVVLACFTHIQGVALLGTAALGGAFLVLTKSGTCAEVLKRSAAKRLCQVLELSRFGAIELARDSWCHPVPTRKSLHCICMTAKPAVSLRGG